MTIDALVQAGRIERVPSDLGFAQNEIGQAEVHLASARLLLETDPVMAYTAAYDAARKAVTAHMRAKGYRVSSGTGNHAKTFEYAAAALGHRAPSTALEQLDDMRTVRNNAEYRGRDVGRAEVEADLEIARVIVSAVAEDL